MKIRKIVEEYIVTDEHDGKEIIINIVVHLQDQERKVSIHGRNTKFEFKYSDPYLVEKLIEMISKGLEMVHNVERVEKK